MNLKRQEEGDVLTKYYHKLNIYFINISLYSQRIALAVVQVKITKFCTCICQVCTLSQFQFSTDNLYCFLLSLLYSFLLSLLYSFLLSLLYSFLLSLLYCFLLSLLYIVSFRYCCTLFPFVNIFVHCHFVILYNVSFCHCCTLFPFENSVRCFLLSFSNTLCSIYNILKALHIISIY